MNSQALKDLLNKLTLDEKIAQLQQLSGNFYYGVAGEITGPFAEMNISEATINNSGSVLGVTGAENVIKIQTEYLKNNPHGIPLLFMADIVHGYQTIFPIPLAIGCSWDMELAEQSAFVAAKESAVSGVHVTFAPMVDLVRDPRWGRVLETKGEDPYLNSEFAKAFVRGFQGDDLANDMNRVAACVKHFAAYGAPEGGRDYNTVNMSERELRENYLPAYKAALDAGCEMVMTAFNLVDGIPATSNKWLMRDLLRNEWGFDGVLISDWGAVGEAIPHGVAADEKEAALKTIIAGTDIEMMTVCYDRHLKELVESGEVDVALIDEAVMRILELKNKLGLFENPLRAADVNLEKEVVYSDEHRAVARELAEQSIVLLKNENILPLKAEQKVALIGPLANSREILGAWCWRGDFDLTDPLSKPMQARGNVTVANGCDLQAITEAQISEAVAVAQDADVIVLALGEAMWMSGEASCRSDIKLPQAQLDLVQRMKALGKPIVTVLFNGRPLDLHGILHESDAVVEAWFPGSEGAIAVTNILYGGVNPTGKLSMTFPYSVGQVPVYYNHFNTGRPNVPEAANGYVSKYLDIPNQPLFPFGFGLSYTTFAYENLHLSNQTMTNADHLTISATITNTGAVAGTEIVQLYVRDLVGEISRPLKELKGYEKVTLEPGASKVVQFTITEADLRYYHADLSLKSDAGMFSVYVGPNSAEGLTTQFELKI